MTPDGKCESQAEAFRLLKKFRALSIARFRETAIRMLSDGRKVVTAREVINQMKAEGSYRDHGGDFWSGVAFAGDKRFAPITVSYLPGEAYSDQRPTKRAHGAYHVMGWSLRADR